MKQKTVLKFIVIVLFIAGATSAGYYFLLLPHLKPKKPASTAVDQLFGWKFPVAKFPSVGSGDKLAYSDIRDPGGVPQGLPVRLKIPIIGVNSAIEDAFITDDGRMDVPAGSVNVAWFSLGPHPGKEGSAVIGGHYGVSNGVEFVFYLLDKMKVGDKIYIVDDKNNTLAFQVRLIKLFDRDADATTVFTSDDGLAHLNLITCEGIWNQVNDTYPQRRVVFSDLIPSEGAVVVTAPDPVVSQPTQPTDDTPGSTPEPTNVPVVSQIPAENIVEPSVVVGSPGLRTKLAQSVKSLYATAVDGLITSFLLISNILVLYKTIRG